MHSDSTLQIFLLSKLLMVRISQKTSCSFFFPEKTTKFMAFQAKCGPSSDRRDKQIVRERGCPIFTANCGCTLLLKDPKLGVLSALSHGLTCYTSIRHITVRVKIFTLNQRLLSPIKSAVSLAYFQDSCAKTIQRLLTSRAKASTSDVPRRL